MSKPTENFTWAETGETKPPETGLKQAGYKRSTDATKGYAPFYQELNWMFRLIGRWMRHLNRNTLVYDHILSTQAEVALENGTIWFDSTDNPSPMFRDKDNAQVIPTTGQSIIIHDLDLIAAGKTITFDNDVVFMTGKSSAIDLNGQNLVCNAAASGELILGNGTLVLKGNCKELRVNHDGSVTIDDTQATGTVIENGQLRSKQALIIQKQQKNPGKSLFFNGTDQQVSIIDHSNLNVDTEDFTLNLTFRTNSDFTAGLGTLLQKGDVSIYLQVAIDTTNKLAFTLLESGGSAQTITSNQTVNDGLIHVAYLRAEKGGSMSMVIDGVLQTLTLPRPATTLTTTEPLYLGAKNLTDEFTGELFSAEIWNRLLTVEECQNLTDPDRTVDYADRQANQQIQTSGTLEIGKRYRIHLFAAGDDFLNVGAAANQTGEEFIATGTTPTTWVNTSELVRIGRLAGYLPETIDWKTNTWFDVENENDGTITGAKTTGADPRIEFTDLFDHIVTTQGHQNQISNSSRILRIDEVAQNFKQQDGSIATISEGARILIAGRDTPGNDLVLPAVNHLKIECERAYIIPMGGFNIVAPGLYNKINLRLDEDYHTRANIDPEINRVFKNQGHSSHVIINDEEYFRGYVTIEMLLEPPKTPYWHPLENQWYEGYPDASNTGLCLFWDLWALLGGDPTLQLGPRTNPRAAVSATWPKVQVVGEAGQFPRQAPILGASLDPDIHTRPSPNGVGTGTTSVYTVGPAANEIKMDRTNIEQYQRGLRVYDAGGSIPGPPAGSPKTTVVADIVENAANNYSIFLKDFETGADVPTASASGALTVDGGGAVSLSVQEDAMQRVTGQIDIAAAIHTNGGALRQGVTAGAPTPGSGTSINELVFDNALSTNPNPAKTNDVENRPTNVNTIFVIKS